MFVCPAPQQPVFLELWQRDKGLRFTKLPEFSVEQAAGDRKGMCVSKSSDGFRVTGILYYTPQTPEGEQLCTACTSSTLRPTSGRREGKGDPNSSATPCPEQARAWGAAAAGACPWPAQEGLGLFTSRNPTDQMDFQ